MGLQTAILLLVVAVSSLYAFPQGAPASTCTSLEPRHDTNKPKISLSPYSVMVAKQVAVKGDKLKVMITSSPEGIPFVGFILQARKPGSTTPLGIFTEIPNNATYLDCPGGTGSQNTVTHQNAFKKKNMEFHWQPPTDYDGDVIFNASVVEDFANFWTGLVSDPVRVADHSGDNSSHSVGISTTKAPRTTTTPEPYSPEITTKAAVRNDPLYDGCSSTKTCFGSSDDCIDLQNCAAFVSCLVKGSTYEFEMKAEDAQYIAVGLSEDNLMGEDSVVECVRDGPASKPVNIYMSWNPEKRNVRLNSSNDVELLSGSAVDGGVQCKFTRSEVTEVMGKTFDLAKNKYYLLLASNGLHADNSIAFHKVYVASEQSKYLSDVSGFTGASKLLLRLHGAFMIGAWIGCASLGILLARYFRQTWVGTQFCGKDLWFTWHRFFMLLTWSLTVVAFVLIFVDRKEWSQEKNPHAILGVITTLLALIQPFGAAFRPHPDSRRRPIFNWLHWLVGNVAHILAIVTIFFAGKLGKAEIPDFIWIWILVGYVAFHVFTHLLLSIAGCISERQGGKRVNSFPMNDISNSRMPLQSAERKQDAPHSCFRKVVLGFYIVGVVGLTAVLVIIVVWAPIEKQWEKVTQHVMSN